MQRLASSKLWGLVYIQTETWEECEKVIGMDVSNPLESIDWLYKINYFGRFHVLSTPVKHIQITANSTLTSDRSVSDMSITAGYNTDDNGLGIGITLSATLCANAGTHTTGSVVDIKNRHTFSFSFVFHTDFCSAEDFLSISL